MVFLRMKLISLKKRSHGDRPNTALEMAKRAWFWLQGSSPMQLGLIAPAIRVDFRRPQVAATDFVNVRLILIHPPVAHAPTPLWKSCGSRSSYTSKLPKFSDTKELANVSILDPEIYIPPPGQVI